VRFDDEALLEVAHVVGIFNYLTRLADGFGLQLDSAVEEAARTGVALKTAGELKDWGLSAGGGYC
jgi:hypothetical protein